MSNTLTSIDGMDEQIRGLANAALQQLKMSAGTAGTPHIEMMRTFAADALVFLINSPGLSLPLFLEHRGSLFKVLTPQNGGVNDFSPERLKDLCMLLARAVIEANYRTNISTGLELRAVHVADAMVSSGFVQQPDANFLRTGLLSQLISTQFEELNASSRLIAESIHAGLDEKLGKVSERVDGWEAHLSGWETKVTSLLKILKEKSEEVNFVGLSRAFSGLVAEKQIEKRRTVLFLEISGGSLFLVPALSAGFVTGLANSAGASLAASGVAPFVAEWVLRASPFVVTEFIVFYFFRIILKNYYSIDGQLLQLRLRLAICQFVQGYGEFVVNHRSEAGDHAFEKFESMIFSGISGNPEKIPSQFDGLEQLVKLFKAAKGVGSGGSEE